MRRRDFVRGMLAAGAAPKRSSTSKPQLGRTFENAKWGAIMAPRN
jgi:hypothetical protein